MREYFKDTELLYKPFRVLAATLITSSILSSVCRSHDTACFVTYPLNRNNKRCLRALNVCSLGARQCKPRASANHTSPNCPVPICCCKCRRVRGNSQRSLYGSSILWSNMERLWSYCVWKGIGSNVAASDISSK